MLTLVLLVYIYFLHIIFTEFTEKNKFLVGSFEGQHAPCSLACIITYSNDVE